MIPWEIAVLAFVAGWGFGKVRGFDVGWDACEDETGKSYRDPNPRCTRCDLQMIEDASGMRWDCAGCGLGTVAPRTG